MPGDRVYPLAPWWQDRFDLLDDGYDPRDDPATDDFEPWVDVDEPRIGCQFDETDDDI